MDATAGLPRGRHGLSRSEVEAHQRLRILAAVADCMSGVGYGATSVADIIRSAGVSRETFYQLFDNKLDAFMAAYDVVADVLVEALDASGGAVTPDETLHHLIDTYLGMIIAAPEWARLFLVEVHAAGPEAAARRNAIQERVGEAIASAVGAVDPEARFAIRVVVAAMGPLVEEPLRRGDLEAIRDLSGPLTLHVTRLLAAAPTVRTEGAATTA